jgi:hypothetical protein
MAPASDCAERTATRTSIASIHSFRSTGSSHMKASDQIVQAAEDLREGRFDRD